MPFYRKGNGPMELATAQRLMAQIFTNADFRAQVAADPEAVVEQLNLSSSDGQWLQNYAANEGQKFARSLIRKRMGILTKMLPITKRWLGEKFGECFTEFAKNHDTKGVHRHLHDALDFSAWLLSTDLSGEPDWFRKVIDYERSWLKAQASKRFFRIRFYRHNMMQLRHVQDRKDMKYAGRPNLVIWCKWSPGSDPRERFYFPRIWPD